jgi:hypothetical protein
VRGTRTLADIYQRCNVAAIEPTNYKEAATDQKWLDAMKEELKMIEKESNMGIGGQTSTQKSHRSQMDF